MKLFDKMSDKLVVIADKVGRLLYINIIRDTFSLLMPLVIAGALCTLASNVICSTTTAGPSLAKISSLAFLEDFTPIFTAINFATLNFFAVAVAMMIGASLGAKRGLNSTVSSVVALASYITVCSSTMNVTFGEETQVVSNVLSGDYTGSKGLFLAIIMGIVSVELLAKMIKSGKLAIHMPDMFPPNVTLAFQILFPACLTLLIISVFEFAVTSLTGMGLLKGNQTQLGFLYPKTTDFIYSVIGEEMGFIVAGGIILLYVYLITKCIYIAKTAKDRAGSLIAIGITGIFLFHVVENIGMVMGLLPITGVPLPFISYGGSSLITNFICIGLLLNISGKRQKTIFVQ